MEECFYSENEKKNSEIENGHRNSEKKKKKKPKIRAHQQEIRSQRVAAREAADSLDFPALDLDETEFEEQDSNSDEAEIVDPTTERCIKTHFFHVYYSSIAVLLMLKV